MSCAFTPPGPGGGRTPEEGGCEGHKGLDAGFRASRASGALTHKPGGEPVLSALPMPADPAPHA